MQKTSISLKLTAFSTLFFLIGIAFLGGYAFHTSYALIERLQENTLLDSTRIAAVDAEVRGQRQLFISIGLVVTALGTAIIFCVTRNMVHRPLQTLKAFTDKVASGDFNSLLEGNFHDPFGEFADSLRRLAGEFKSRLGFSEGALAGIPTPYCVVGPDCKVLWINSEIYGLLEKTAHWQSYEGQSAGEFYFGDPNRETLSETAIKEKHAKTSDLDYVSPSGKIKHISERASPIYDFDGKLLGVISFWTDLTEIHVQKQRIEDNNAVIARTASKATDVSNRIAAASNELSSQIEQSNRGAQEQNKRVHETSAAMVEMNATIFEVAKNAATSAQSAVLAAEKARQGAKLVEEVAAAVRSVREEAMMLTENMRGLGEQAQGIGTIVGVISDIADQTNLLALNAAIEAARAGDAGRGFAVVADEVRKLAEKTISATREVGQVIAGIQQGTISAVTRVGNAVALVGQASEMAGRSGSALVGIVTVVEAVGDQVRSIATAAEQQSATSEEINRAVTSISAIAVETAQGMHQSAKAVSGLSRQAQELNSLISELNTG